MTSIARVRASSCARATHSRAMVTPRTPSKASAASGTVSMWEPSTRRSGFAFDGCQRSRRLSAASTWTDMPSASMRARRWACTVCMGGVRKRRVMRPGSSVMVAIRRHSAMARAAMVCHGRTGLLVSSLSRGASSVKTARFSSAGRPAPQYATRYSPRGHGVRRRDTVKACGGNADASRRPSRLRGDRRFAKSATVARNECAQRPERLASRAGPAAIQAPIRSMSGLRRDVVVSIVVHITGNARPRFAMPSPRLIPEVFVAAFSIAGGQGEWSGGDYVDEASFKEAIHKCVAISCAADKGRNLNSIALSGMSSAANQRYCTQVSTVMGTPRLRASLIRGDPSRGLDANDVDRRFEFFGKANEQCNCLELRLVRPRGKVSGILPPIRPPPHSTLRLLYRLDLPPWRGPVTEGRCPLQLRERQA